MVSMRGRNNYFLSRKGFSPAYITILIVLSLTLVAGAVYFFGGNSKHSLQAGSQPLPYKTPAEGTSAAPQPTLQASSPAKTSAVSSSAGGSGNDCGSTKKLFSVSPVSLDKISTVVPLGNFEPRSHIAPTTQIYVRYLREQNAPALTTLYAPADMTVTQIWLFDNNSSQTPFNSYRIDFTLCSGVSGYFIHAITINDKLMAAMHEPYDYAQTSDVGLAKPDHVYRKDVSVALRAGEVLGTAGGKSIYPDALDFGLSDSRVSAGVVANPARWEDMDLHYVCPLDYFSPDISAALYAKLGDFDGKLISINSPKCGQVYQDVPGTAQGVWISKAAANPSIFDVSNLLTLGHHSFDHAQGVFVMGNVLRQLGFDNSFIYGFSPRTAGKVNVDFNKIVPDGNVYCYQNINQSDPRSPGAAVLLQLLDANTLRIGQVDGGACGSGPWQFGKYLDFIR